MPPPRPRTQHATQVSVPDLVFSPKKGLLVHAAQQLKSMLAPQTNHANFVFFLSCPSSPPSQGGSVSFFFLERNIFDFDASINQMCDFFLLFALIIGTSQKGP